MGTKVENIVVNTFGADRVVESRMVDAGEPVQIGSFGHSRTVMVNRVYELSYEGEVIGYAQRRLVTREQRTPGRRYVNRRWESPAWLACDGPGRYERGFEKSSRKDVAYSLLFDHLREQMNEAAGS